jgi:hypothetical protein
MRRCQLIRRGLVQLAASRRIFSVHRHDGTTDTLSIPLPCRHRRRFSFNVTLRGFAGPFAVAFFLGGMSEMATAEETLERRAGDRVVSGS